MTYDELTAGLSRQNAAALALCPGWIGGDSTDIETFVEDIYRKPVTDDNYKHVAQLFRQWYKQVAPNEYHDPPSEFSPLGFGHGGARLGAGMKPVTDVPQSRHEIQCTDEIWLWLREIGDGNASAGLREVYQIYRMYQFLDSQRYPSPTP